MIVPAILAGMFVVVAGNQLAFMRERRRIAALRWDEILGKAERLNNEGLELIAECYLRPSNEQPKLEPGDIWVLIGGTKGLKQLRRNVAVILDLALAAQRWNREEAVLIAELLRGDAIRIRRAQRGLELCLLWNGDTMRAAVYLQRTAAAYCGMRQRLLDLYGSSHAALVPQFGAAL